MSTLHGVRLLTLALNLPGPAAVARLVAEGASAVKVEPPAGDPLRTYCPAWYDALHVAVTTETIDLKTDAGRTRVEAMLAGSDVLLTSHRPSALRRLGLDAVTLAARFPRLRRVDIVGDTAAPDRAGHDVIYQMEADLIGDALPRTLLADLVGAEQTVSAVLLALAAGPGAHRVVGLRDAAYAVAEPRRRGLTSAGGLLGGALAAYGVYRARDGAVAVAALEPHFRARLYDVLALPMDAPLAAAAAERTCDAWAALAAAHDLPIAVRRADPGPPAIVAAPCER